MLDKTKPEIVSSTIRRSRMHIAVVISSIITGRLVGKLGHDDKERGRRASKQRTSKEGGELQEANGGP